MKTKTMIAGLGTALLLAMAWGQAHSSRALFERYFVAEVPPSAQGGTVQVAVKLPASAKIAKTQVMVADSNLGSDMKGWSSCNNDRKSCELDDLSIIKFHRTKSDEMQVLAVDMRNAGNEARYAKLRVVFQTQAGIDITDPTGCGSGTKVECGYSGPVESK